MPAFDAVASVLAARDQSAEGCCKRPEDLSRYRVLLERYRPDVVVETGTFAGGSAAWFAREGDCPVVTVDVGDRIDGGVWPITPGADRVVRVVGDSVDHATVSEVFDWVAGYARPLVVLDSDHSAEHVWAELCAYAPLVPVGGFVVVEDGVVRFMDDAPCVGSPLDAIERWLDRYPDWVVDAELCGMHAVSMHPKGFLRRVR